MSEASFEDREISPFGFLPVRKYIDSAPAGAFLHPFSQEIYLVHYKNNLNKTQSSFQKTGLSDIKNRCV